MSVKSSVRDKDTEETKRRRGEEDENWKLSKDKVYCKWSVFSESRRASHSILVNEATCLLLLLPVSLVLFCSPRENSFLLVSSLLFPVLFLSSFFGASEAEKHTNRRKEAKSLHKWREKKKKDRAISYEGRDGHKTEAKKQLVREEKTRGILIEI